MQFQVTDKETVENGIFTDELMQSLHKLMLDGLFPSSKAKSIGRYKQCDNFIVNSVGTVVFSPPPHTETTRYMRELLAFMNNSTDGINPLSSPEGRRREDRLECPPALWKPSSPG